MDRLSDSVSTLALVSERTPGVRLSDILALAERESIPLDINAALCLIRQLVPAVALMHEHAKEIAHGAIGPERLVVTPQAHLVIVEYVMGAALEQLRFSHSRYWKELRIALPRSAGLPHFDHRADVTQLGVVALSLILGRPLHEDEYPGQVRELLASAWAISARGGLEPLTPGLRSWLARALQLDLRDAFPSAIEALAALDEVLSGDSQYIAAPAELETFLERYHASADASVEKTPARPPVMVVSAPAATAHLNEVRPVESRPVVVTPARPPSVKVAPPPPQPVRNDVAPAPAFESATPIYQPPPRVESAPVKPFIEARTPQVSPQASQWSGRILRRRSKRRRQSTSRRPGWNRRRRRRSSPSSTRSRCRYLRRRFATIRSPHSTLRRGSRLRPSSNRRHGNRSRPTSSRTSVPLYETRSRCRRFHPCEKRWSCRCHMRPTKLRRLDTRSRSRSRRRARRRNLRRYAVAAVVLIALVGGGFMFARRSSTSAPAAAGPAAGTGTLTVNTTPTGAEVLVDGEPRGVTPLDLSLNAGAHVLVLRGAGEPRTIPVTIVAGAQASQYIELAKGASASGQLQIRYRPAGRQSDR